MICQNVSVPRAYFLLLLRTKMNDLYVTFDYVLDGKRDI